MYSGTKEDVVRRLNLKVGTRRQRKIVIEVGVYVVFCNEIGSDGVCQRA